MTTDDKRNLTANVINIASRRTDVNAKRASVTAGVVKVTKARANPKRLNVQSPLTKEHREELREMVTEWVSLRNLSKRPLTYGAAWTKLYTEHLKGEVAHINEIEEGEFEGCRNWVLQQVRITEHYNPKQARKNPNYTNSRLKRIHARCKNLGIPDDVRKQYQIDRWGKESLTEFSDSELEDFVRYVQTDNPTFQHKERVHPRDNELRERALVALLDDLELSAKAKGEQFDRHALRYTKEDIRQMLMKRDRQLFTISSGTFEEFWKKKRKGICSVKSGRRSNQA